MAVKYKKKIWFNWLHLIVILGLIIYIYNNYLNLESPLGKIPAGFFGYLFGGGIVITLFLISLIVLYFIATLIS